MTEPRQIAVVRSYDELIAALRARAIELGATRKRIGEVAGLADGHVATLLALGGKRTLGRESAGPLFGALGVMLLVVEDTEAMAKHTSRIETGKRNYQLNGVQNAPVILKFSRRYMKKIARMSAQGRMKKIPAWKRRKIARKAGRASALKRAGIQPADQASRTRGKSTSAAASPATAQRSALDARSSHTER